MIKLTAIRLYSAAIVLASEFLFARWAGIEEYGLYSAAWAFIVIAGGSLQFGFSISATRIVSEFVTNDTAGDVERFSKTAVMFTLSAALVLALVLAPISTFTYELLPIASLLFALLISPLMSLLNINRAILQALRDAFEAFLPIYFVRPTLTLTLTALALVLTGTLTASNILFSITLSLAAVLLYQTIQILRTQGARSDAPTRTWVTRSRPFYALEVVGTWSGMIDVFIVSLILTPIETGAYFAATRLVAAIQIASFATTEMSLRNFAVFHIEKRFSALRREIAQALFLSVSICAVACIGLYLVADYIFAIFGPDFVEPGVALAPVLLTGAFVFFSMMPLHAFLRMANSEGSLLRIAGVTLIVGIGAQIALITEFGIMGAAMAYVVTAFIHSTGLVLTVLRKFTSEGI